MGLELVGYVLAGLVGLLAVLFLIAHGLVRWHHGPHAERIFDEKPLFMVPRGERMSAAEDVRIPTTDGLQLAGCYFRTHGPRKGVILFGLEFGSSRWSCHAYCEALIEAGYDVFAYEPRNQGDSDKQADYKVTQWITDRDLADCRSALAYLKQRPDADVRGVGLFGISKGGGVGLLAAAGDPFVRCCATDGVYATLTTIVPYMLKWLPIYTPFPKLAKRVPASYIRFFARGFLRRIGRQRGLTYPSLESALAKLAPRPWLLIHGGGDTYIKPAMAEQLFACARQPKEYWLIPKAKHNQALTLVGELYRDKVRGFFDQHLAVPVQPSAISA